MRRIPTIAASLVLLLAAAPAGAFVPQGEAYVALRGSLAWAEEINNHTAPAIEMDLTTGGGASLAAGWRIPQGLKVEGELLYRHLPVTGVRVGGFGIGPIAAEGDVQMLAPMLNVLYTAPLEGWWLKPYAGLGVGAAYVIPRVEVGGVEVIEDDAWGIAWQVMAGLEGAISERTTVSIGYRYHSVHDVELTDSAGNSDQLTVDHHSIDFGLTTRF